MKNTSLFFQRVWRTGRPWLVSLALILALRYTGVLGGISYVMGTILLKTGLMNASTEGPPVLHDFDYDFSVRDLEGKVVNVRYLRGKTLFINVWATWCGPCRIEMPSIEALYNQTDSSRIAFLMISVDDNGKREEVKEFIAVHGFTFPVYTPIDALPDVLQVRSIPSTFIVSPKGKIVMFESGLSNYNTLKVKEFLNSVDTNSN
jgi:thiol-disulfide isomerase/thioredoxin